MGKYIKNNIEIYTRDVLISTGEFSKEVVIKNNQKEIYESCPVGSTVGDNEASIITLDKSKDIFSLDFDKILGLSQGHFDKIISKNLNSQITTALSLVHFKFLATKEGISNDYLYKFISKYYKKEEKFPIPIFNILNGGKHAGNNLPFCEFMIIPRGGNIKENINIASEIYQDLRNIIDMKYGPQNVLVGREGGFAPDIDNVEHAIELIKQAINVRNLGKCYIGIDIAANNFSEKSNSGDSINFNYFLGDKSMSTQELLKFYIKLIEKFPEIFYLEDSFNEYDLDGWSKIKELFGDKIMITGDDLTVTNLKFIKKYKNLINSVILKINQVGNLTDTIKSFEFCKNNNMKTIISQRSGETDSDFISHLAVGLGSDYIKAGAPARERIIKYNSLIRILERDL